MSKNPYTPSPSIDFKPAAHDSETHRVPMFENDDIRIWKTIIHPNSPLKMHRHDHSRVLVALKGGTLKRVEDTGAISYLSFETGKAYLLNEDPGTSQHADVNESDEAIEVLVIEFKQNA